MGQYTCPPGQDTTYYGLLVGSVDRAREVLADQLSLGAVDSAFSALAVYEARVEELGQLLRGAIVTLQQDQLNGEGGE